ncbi:MAG: hypothetical protein AB2693_31895 [Candidatus Thiodiazotropha sp.]
MLSDKDFYKLLDENPHKGIMKSYSKYLEKYESNLTVKEFDYLTNFDNKESNFYGLPKIHKCRDINEACLISDKNYVALKAPVNLTFRPIVAGPICETHRLSNLIDILLQSYSKHIKSFIKDTTDFFSKLPTTVSPETILVPFDVESLYTNIPHDLGLKAIQYWLEEHPQELPSRINKSFRRN